MFGFRTVLASFQIIMCTCYSFSCLVCVYLSSVFLSVLCLFSYLFVLCVLFVSDKFNKSIHYDIIILPVNSTLKMCYIKHNHVYL